MIFSVSSTCLAYAIGIFVSTIYVRNLKLVGAGFFWMMWATTSSFLFLSVISSNGNIKYSCIVGFSVSLVLLGKSIYQRNSVREKIDILEYGLYLIGVISIVVADILIASTNFEAWELVREISRLVVGGMLLGIVTSAMLLGHWYLVQPGLTRKPISKMCKASMFLLFADIALWLVPTSMLAVLSGSISDGWGGTLGYMWAGSAVTTAGLLFVAYKALQEKSYSAVMATTGLLYLAILVANGVELIPRAIFS